MKKAYLLIFIFSAFASGIQAQTFYGSTDLKVFRDGRDEEFRDKKQSPLNEQDFAAFKGLNYYPVNKDFRVTATFTPTPSEKWFQMPTSSGATAKYNKFGILKFKVNRKPFVLSAYRIDPAIAAKFPEYADLLFVPFKDTTNRTDTYGGGRYINIKVPKGQSIILDFNLAYNPHCAYGGEKWSCPIPPSENTLGLVVTAGEKRFAYSGSTKTP